MNILYCGDKNIEDGLIISVLSLTEHCKEALHIFVLTVNADRKGLCCEPVSDGCIAYLDRLVSVKGGFVKKKDITEEFFAELPVQNLKTRFTPWCMLRLYADLVPEIPDKILYLDNDVVCRQDIGGFYHQDLEEYELAGVLDQYGKWFFRKNPFHMDYLNSGVLLLNMKKIRQSGLLKRCRKRCAEKRMFMPDQSALNKLAVKKVLRDRRYNEQEKLRQNTVLQHFTTSLKFFPWLHSLTIKPWQVEELHSRLKIYEYDPLLEQYQKIRLELGAES